MALNQKTVLTEQKYSFLRPISRQRFLVYGALSFGLSLLNSCHNQVEIAPLRIGINDWIGYQIINAAHSLGYFKKRDVAIDLIYFNNLQDATRAMYRGTLDASFTTLWDLLEQTPERQQVQPRILLVSDISAGADGIVARSPWQDFNDLRGKKVGVKLATVNHLILLEALKFHQISPTQIEMINVPNEVSAQQLLEGKLDASVLWQPLLGEIADKTRGKIVYNTSQTDSLVIDVLASTEAAVQQKAQSLQRFLWVWLDLMHQIEQNPASVFKILSAKIGRPFQEIRQDYQGVRPGTLALNQHFFGQDSQLTQAIAAITELIQADPHHPKPIIPLGKIDRSFTLNALRSWTAPP